MKQEFTKNPTIVTISTSSLCHRLEEAVAPAFYIAFNAPMKDQKNVQTVIFSDLALSESHQTDG